MADTKITALTALTGADPANDVIPIVDVSDTTMAASGTTKKISVNNILGASGTATLASATITGALTLSAGTANGVPYLNASKIVTTSDKLSFAQTGGFYSTTFNINSLLGSANYKAGIVVTEDNNSFSLYGGSGYKLIDAYGYSTPNQLRFYASNVEQYRIDASGVFNWYDGAGGTRMTLNATGLGVGVGPSYPFHLRNSASAIAMVHSTNANGPYVVFQNSTANFGDIGSELSITGGGSAGNMTINSRLSSNLCFSVSDTVRMRIDSSGNVGIGVTPSAWGSGNKAFEGGISGGKTGALMFGGDGSSWLINNAIIAASTTYKATAAASYYYQNGGQHIWSNAPSGTAGTAITWTQAMTLDTSGNLLVGSALPVSGGRISGNSSTGPAGRFFSSAGDNQFAAMFDKSSATNTTSQWLIGFTINNQATGSGQINANGASQAAFGTFSDSRLKENIVSLPSQLANILSLRPVEFDYKDGSGHQIGFVAQEMQEVYSDTVSEQNGFLTVTGWSKTEARLVSAIKELAAKVQALEAKLA